MGAVGSLVVRASDSRPEDLGSMLDVTKYPPSAHGFTCRNCGGGDRGRVAIYRPFGEVSLSLNRTVTCMVLKANDRRTSCPCHDEFRGPRSDYVRQNYHTHLAEEYANYRKPPDGADTFQCNNRIVMHKGSSWMIFYVVKLLDDWNVNLPSWKYPEKLGIAQSIISRFWQRFQDDGNVPVTTKRQENTIERHGYGGEGWLIWGGIILGSRTDLHVQSVTMTDHIYRDVILEQHVCLFRGAMGAEVLSIDDNARPHHANIVDECLQSEDITHMDWPAYSPDLNLIEHV
ncbi:transposable element Tc3 transposase [Trichonephila clavipes]|nr:transposable element Tc3 transposase [Trichonephila clavipes]